MGLVKSLGAEPHRQDQLWTCVPNMHPRYLCGGCLPQGRLPISCWAGTLSLAMTSGTGHPGLLHIHLLTVLAVTFMGSHPLYSLTPMVPSEALLRALSITAVEMVTGQATRVHEGSRTRLYPHRQAAHLWPSLRPV